MSKDTFDIWQLRHDPSSRALLFMDSEYLEKHGMAIDLANYELKYHDEWKLGDTLNGIYERFNIDRGSLPNFV